MKELFGIIIIAVISTSCVETVTELEFEEQAGFGQSSDYGDRQVQFGTHFQKAIEVLTKYECMSCHGSGSGKSHGDFSKFLSEEDWVKSGLVVRQKPDESLLIKELINFGASNSNMPLDGQKLAQQDYEILRTWIQQMYNPSAPVRNPAGSVETNLILAPLGQFVDQMENLYRIDGTNGRNRIFQHIYVTVGDLWGAGCDYYKSAIERLESNRVVHFQNFAACDYGGLENSASGTHSVVKAGTRINLCERFVDDSNYLNAFYQRHLGGSKSFSKASMKKIFHLYYPALEYQDSIHNGFLKALADNGGSGLSDDRKWRTYLSTLCQSLYWEVH